jgi:hypothetical protein
VVEEYQTPQSSTTNRHYHDLKYASFILYYAIAKKMKGGLPAGKRFFVDVVLETSRVIEEITLMRE